MIISPLLISLPLVIVSSNPEREDGKGPTGGDYCTFGQRSAIQTISNVTTISKTTTIW